MTAPLSFLKKVEHNIELTQQIPLWGACPCFPWEALSTQMQKEIGDPHFRLVPILQEAMASDQFLSPFGSDPQSFSLQLAPLSGTMTWVLAKESLLQISSLILQGQPDVKDSSDPRFQEGFFQFLLLQISQKIEELKVYPDLHIQWIKEAEIPKETSFVIDVSIELKEKSFLSRLIIPQQLHEAFASHFIKEGFDPLSAPISAKIDLPLTLEIGSCTITQEEWASIRPGDLLLLDQCSYDPETQKGSANLSWKGTPFFKIKIKKTNIKIMDYAVYNGEPNHG